MARLRALGVILGLGLLLAMPATASAANRYTTYAACGTSSSAAPSHSCSKSSTKAAFFKSLDAAVSYTVCVKYPSGTKLCANAQSAPKGKLQHNTITSSMKGTHKITWKVAGVKVGAWTLNVT
jgi:hypothetical protein